MRIHVDYNPRTAADGGYDLIWHLTRHEASACGMDAAQIHDWAGTILYAITALRTLHGNAGHAPPPTRDQWGTILNDMLHLRDRVEGVINATVRAHIAAGRPAAELAAYLNSPDDVGEDYHQAIAAGWPPNVWTRWATGDLNHRPDASTGTDETAQER